jgi:hypothetical protein
MSFHGRTAEGFASGEAELDVAAAIPVLPTTTPAMRAAMVRFMGFASRG